MNINKRFLTGTAAACLGMVLLAGCNKTPTPAAEAPPAAAPAAAAPAPVAAPTGSITITEPADGATVSSPFKVKFGAEGVKIEPAGAIAAGSGHHHLLINTGPIAEGQTIPMDDTHLHYGKAQTETELTLTPGKHTLQLVAGDKLHMQFNPTVASKVITVNVK